LSYASGELNEPCGGAAMLGSGPQEFRLALEKYSTDRDRFQKAGNYIFNSRVGCCGGFLFGDL